MPPSRSPRTHRLAWDGQPVARLRPGATALRPLVEVLDSDFLDGAQRERLRVRLQRFVDDRVEADLAPLFRAGEQAAENRVPARSAAPADRVAGRDRRNPRGRRPAGTAPPA